MKKNEILLGGLKNVRTFARKFKTSKTITLKKKTKK